MSLVLPTAASPPADGGVWSPLEQDTRNSPATTRRLARRRHVMRTDSNGGAGRRAGGRGPVGFAGLRPTVATQAPAVRASTAGFRPILRRTRTYGGRCR